MNTTLRMGPTWLALTLVPIAWLLLSLPSSGQEFQPEPGFESLFNGHDLSGWGSRAKKTLEPLEAFDGKTESTSGRFGVTPGVLVAHPRADEDAKRERLYTTREFPDDFVLKLEFRASARADSGLYIRKPQLQVRDYGLVGPYRLSKYQPQEWNELVVTVKGTTAHVACNGEVLETALEVPANGPIGVESDAGTVEYRNIQLKTLE